VTVVSILLAANAHYV